MLVDDALPAAAVRGTIRSSAPSTLVSIVEFDRYHGKGVPDGRVSLSLRLTFRAPDRTLTDEEVQAATGKIVEALRPCTAPNSASDAAQGARRVRVAKALATHRSISNPSIASKKNSSCSSAWSSGCADRTKAACRTRTPASSRARHRAARLTAPRARAPSWRRCARSAKSSSRASTTCSRRSSSLNL